MDDCAPRRQPQIPLGKSVKEKLLNAPAFLLTARSEAPIYTPLVHAFSKAGPLSLSDATGRHQPGYSGGINRGFGEVPEWLKGTDCKSVGYAYAGSNPALSTSLRSRSDAKAATPKPTQAKAGWLP